ncbi:MAG: cyclase family protein [Candidatus Eisenbacteria bacterium]|nr:cyclase family protein [Candidatus Eisenbacteria bacterium]
MRRVRLIDITPAVSPALEGWPGDTRFDVSPRWSLAAGDSCTVSRVTLSSHAGAHADAPLHFAPDGEDAAALSLEPYMGPARVVQCPDVAEIGHAEALWAAGAERVLYRVLPPGAETGFPRAFPALTVEGARTLARLGVRLFGTDAPSVDAVDSKTLDAHHALRAGGVAILEGLALAEVPAGEYELIALPLKWRGVDAAPVRAVLRVGE